MSVEDEIVPVRRVAIPVGMKLYDEKFKLHAVQQYLLLGNLSLVADILGVAYKTMKVWKSEPWWKEVEQEIKASRRLITDSKLSSIVDRALEITADRLEHGDFIYDQKSQQLVRKPVGIKDAVTTVNNLLQRQHILEKEASNEVNSEATKTISEQLTQLAGEFAKFNNRGKAAATTIAFKENEDIDAVHEEGSQDR